MSAREPVPHPLGVAPLCAVSAPVEQYLGAAAAAGFEFAGIRVTAVTESDVVYAPGGRAFKRLVRAVAESGLRVLDSEVFALAAGTSREQWLPALEMTAELGGTVFNVVGRDPDLGSFADALAELTDDARPLGIMPVIEPIAYLPMRSYERAIDIALRAGCGVELDGLHVLRTGADTAIFAGHEDLFPVLQLCDAPAEVRRWGADRPAGARPQDDDLVIESRFNRLLPGQGDSPLGELLGAVAPGTPISVEIPNVALQAERTVEGYMALLHRVAVEFLAENGRRAP